MTMNPASPHPANPAQSSWYKKNEIALTPWLFLAPAILFFMVYVIIPVFQSFNLSLYKWDGLGTSEFVGLRNYSELMAIGLLKSRCGTI